MINYIASGAKQSRMKQSHEPFFNSHQLLRFTGND